MSGFRAREETEFPFPQNDFVTFCQASPTPDGRYVFLESNPNGQFMWIEHRVPELRMTEALASCLIRGANSQA
jgi:hypothetical protein